MLLLLYMSWLLIKQQITEENHFCSFNADLLDLIYMYAMQCFYIWLFNFCTWILLELPEKYKALFI